MTKVFKVIPVAVTVLVSACGGGGGGDGASSGAASAPTGVSITSSNARDATAYAYSGVADLGEQGSYSAGFVTGVAIDMRRAGLISTSLKQLYKGLETRSQQILATGVEIIDDHTVCTGGGSISVAGTMANSAQPSNGDRLSVTSNNCVQDGETLNGKIDFVFSGVSGTVGAATPWSATLALTFTGFSMRGGGFDLSTNGDMKVVVNQTSAADTTLSVSGKSLEMKMLQNGTTTVDRKLTDYSFNAWTSTSSYAYEADFIVSGHSPKVGNTYFTVDTIARFSSSSSTAYPSTGSAKITAPDNSSATLTALDGTNVQIELDRNGDQRIDETINTTWYEITSGV